MTDYLSPGVYVAEASNAERIEGVSASTAGFVGLRVIEDLQLLLNKIAVDGKTQSGGSDLASALLDLLAWLSDELSRRVDCLGNEAYLQAIRIAAASVSIIGRKPLDKFEGASTDQVRFFPGRWLTYDNVKAEMGGKSLHAFGVVSGLNISVEGTGSGSTVHLSPGCVIGNYGQAIVLKKCVSLTVPTTSKHLSVIARIKEHGKLSVAALPLIECEYLVVDEPKKDDFVLGQLEKSSHAWQIVNGK